MTSSRHPKHKKPLVERPGATVELHDQLEDNDIKQIHDIFMKANKRLNSVQLRKILHSVSKITLTDEEFDVIFRRMDASGDGYVTWDEFISYLIVCYQQKEVKAGYETLENPIPTRPILLRSCHRYTVNRIAYVPTVSLLRTYNWQDGSLLTCSRDGTINYWSLDLQLERTVKSGCPNLRTQSTWVTDMVSMPDVSVVCTSSTERDLRFYDTSAKKFDLRVMFTSIDYAVSTMYYSFSKDANQESKLLLGDMGGNIHIIFIESFARGPFKSKLGLPLLEVLYSQVVKGLIEGFRVTIFQRQHTDYIRQIHFSDALHSVISCSDCSRRGLSMKDLVEGKESYVYKAPKGAWCFAYNEKNHIIACGGSDTLVRLFNCFVPSHPIAILHGHRGGIVSMILQDNAKRLYTLSQDKCIKVWDVASQSLLQNYLGLPTELGEHSDMTTLYNPESRQWIIGSTMLAAVAVSPMKNGEHTDGFTHTAGVSVVLYNPLFKHVPRFTLLIHHKAECLHVQFTAAEIIEERLKVMSDIRYYSFPKDEHLCKQWINACRRQDKLDT